MTTNTLRVTDGPVARSTDPIESFEAGDERAAREASEVAVIAALDSNYAKSNHMSDHYIGWWISKHEGLHVTQQRIRTARKQLVAKRLVVAAGRVDGVSPTGRAAMTWKLADR